MSSFGHATLGGVDGLGTRGSDEGETDSVRRVYCSIDYKFDEDENIEGQVRAEGSGRREKGLMESAPRSDTDRWVSNRIHAYAFSFVCVRHPVST